MELRREPSFAHHSRNCVPMYQETLIGLSEHDRTLGIRPPSSEMQVSAGDMLSMSEKPACIGFI